VEITEGTEKDSGFTQTDRPVMRGHLSVVVLWNKQTGMAILRVEGVPIEVTPYEIVAALCQLPVLDLRKPEVWRRLQVSRLNDCDTPVILRRQQVPIVLKWPEVIAD
jgi:hypothetical protein